VLCFDDVDLLAPRLPLFREMTADYVCSLANASDEERSAMALRYMGFSPDTVSEVMSASNAGNTELISEALEKDPASQRIIATEPVVSEAEWSKYTAEYRRKYVVDPSQERDFSPLPCGMTPMLPPNTNVENAELWILQYFIRAYADVLNLICKRYGYLRRQQLLASVLQIAGYHVENGYPIEEIPGILGRVVLDWDEMCKAGMNQ